MAEFKEVMQQIARMCREIHCKECILYNVDNGCMINYSAEWFSETSERIEKEVKEWTTAHTEPVYPSWEDGWKSLFPNASEDACPEQWFGEDCPKDMTCDECLKRPMSKKVAEKLGIKPITTAKDVQAHDGCEGCMWTDKHEDEEPCKNCCGVRGGSAPDLWEER